jgi:hypothetical protein
MGLWLAVGAVSSGLRGIPWPIGLDEVVDLIHEAQGRHATIHKIAHEIAIGDSAQTEHGLRHTRFTQECLYFR